MGKTEKYTDNHLHIKALDRLQEIAGRFKGCVEALQEEGIPVGLNFLKKVSVSDEAYTQYISGEARKYLSSKGFVPKDEKQRVRENFQAVLDRTIGHIREIKEYIGALPVKDVEGVATVTQKELDRMALEKATLYFDMDVLTEYYEKVKAIRTAMEEAKKYEGEHGLPNFALLGEVWFIESQFNTPLCCKFTDFVRRGADFGEFKKYMMKYVEVKG